MKVVLNRKLCFLQVDDGLTHMLDEVFDERLENISESSARAPKTNNKRQKTGTRAEKMDKRKRSELEDESLVNL